MTQGKWSLIHNGLRILVADAYLAAQMFESHVKIKIALTSLALLILIIDSTADAFIKRKLRREDRFIDSEDVSMAWDFKGITTRVVGGVIILTAMIAAFISPERPITNNIQVLSMDVMASPWFRGGAIVAFSAYFMYIAYESYCRNYASERSKKDGERALHEWEE